MLRWLLLLSAAPPAAPVLRGLPVTTGDGTDAAVIALWGREGTEAAGLRCTGVFIAPEVVLTAAACVLRSAPTGLFEHVACAHGGADCPTLPAATLQILAARALPEEREETAEVLSIEFRYSVPSLMPQVCTGGAVCGEGWDIAALRVRQLCPRQRCVPPLPLSLGTLRSGETLRLVGAGVDPLAASSELGGHALRYEDGELEGVRANQTLTLETPLPEGAGWQPGGSSTSTNEPPCGSGSRGGRATS